MISLTLLLVTCSAITLATPHSLFPLKARNDTSPPPPPTINVAITSPNGNDITSSVRTMLYNQPKVVANSDLNARFTPGLSRPQTSCTTRDGDAGPGRFAFSHCTHDDGITGSLQEFITYCYPPRAPKVPEAPGSSSSSSDSDSGTTTPTNKNRRPSKMPFSTPGTCATTEICVNGRGVGSHFDGRKMRKVDDAQVAYCVSKELFVEMAVAAGADARNLPPLEGEQASMVFSRGDGRTPVEVKEMELIAGLGGGVDGETAAGATGPGEKVQGSCADCVDLRSGKFEAGTEGLKAQATLMGVGTSAAAAVLWIAIVSG